MTTKGWDDMEKNEISQLISEMEAIKKLLVLQLLNSGTRQKLIASMLGISEATMSRMIPKSTIIKNNAENRNG